MIWHLYTLWNNHHSLSSYHLLTGFYVGLHLRILISTFQKSILDPGNLKLCPKLSVYLPTKNSILESMLKWSPVFEEHLIKYLILKTLLQGAFEIPWRYSSIQEEIRRSSPWGSSSSHLLPSDKICSSFIYFHTLDFLRFHLKTAFHVQKVWKLLS